MPGRLFNTESLESQIHPESHRSLLSSHPSNEGLEILIQKASSEQKSLDPVPIKVLETKAQNTEQDHLSILNKLKMQVQENPYIPLEQRRKKLKEFRHFLIKHKHFFLESQQEDYYKPSVEFLITEITNVVSHLNHNIKNLKKWSKDYGSPSSLSMSGYRGKYSYHPKGVVLILSPWNYPLTLSLGPLTSAIAAGNRVVLKLSEHVPHLSNCILHMVKELWPDGQVHCDMGGSENAAKWTELPFDHIFFTGSTQIGHKVMSSAAKNITPVSLELGGKSPAIICPQANLKASAKSLVYAKFTNSGQTCVAPDYVLCHESLLNDFCHELEEALNESFGKDERKRLVSDDLAAIVNASHFERLRELLRNLPQEGICVRTGGIVDHSTRRIAPTILTHVSQDSLLMKQEIFGPLLPILTFKDLLDVKQFINRRPPPLACYVYSRRSEDYKELTKDLRSGSVLHNCALVQAANHSLPFGGLGASGMGRSHGKFAFQEFSYLKSSMEQKRSKTLPGFFAPPYGPRKKMLVEFLLRFFGKWI